MANNKDRERLLRDIFFGTETPLEAQPVKSEKYILAWNNIEILRDKIEGDEYVSELFRQFNLADDERAFSSFVQGIEVGKLLYSN